MTPLSVAYVATAAICLVVGLQHLIPALRAEDRRLQFLFALVGYVIARLCYRWLAMRMFGSAA